MFGIIKKMFIVLSTSLINTSSIFNASNHIKCVSLSNQKSEIQPTLISIYPNEYSQELRYSSIETGDISTVLPPGLSITTFLPQRYFGLGDIRTF